MGGVNLENEREKTIKDSNVEAQKHGNWKEIQLMISEIFRNRKEQGNQFKSEYNRTVITLIFC